MPVQMTPTAKAQGSKNALLCAIILIPVLVVFCVINAVVALIFGQPFLLCIGVSGVAIGGLVSLVNVWKRLFGRNTGGRVLLDFGPIPKPKLTLIEALCYLVLGLMFGGGTIQRLMAGGLVTLVSNWGPIIGLLSVISLLLLGLFVPIGRIQVRDDGFWCSGHLLRWDKIGSYRWANDGTLLIRRKGFNSWFQGALPIPLEHKQAVDELLAKHCPAGASAQQGPKDE